MKSLVVFCDLNNYELAVSTAEAVKIVVSVAAGEVDEGSLAEWIASHARQCSDK